MPAPVLDVRIGTVLDRLPTLITRTLISLGLVAAVTAASGCAMVPKNRRRYLADPTMQTEESPLEERARHKLHTSREGAAGGDGQPAGGGCGCGN